MWVEGLENPNHPITGSVSQCAWLFPIRQGYSSRLSFDVSGAVLVQNPHNTIETMDSLDNNTPIYGGE